MLKDLSCRVNVTMRHLSAFPLFILAVLALGAAGCAHVEAYQRGRLAHPTMNPESGTSPALEHVRAVHEGAIGGGAGPAAGCGCN
jgi:hypothetical protein